MAHFQRLWDRSVTKFQRFWPRYRGTRAGRLVQERKKFRRYEIQTIQQRDFGDVASISHQNTQRGHNPSNCVYISPTTEPTNKGSASAFVPSLYLSNVMSLAPKIDEIRHVAENANFDCVCITEAWLQSHKHDNIVALNGFNLVRMDRTNTVHGGVCTFIKDNINFTVLDDLQDESFEALWIKLRPDRLPRSYSCIVLGTIYHPPRANNSAILEYLWKCLSTIESCFSNCGLLIVRDFNRLKIKRLQNSFGLKQIVNFPTRGKGFLDWVFTNLAEFYKDPIQRPSHGLSDHMSVELQPRNRSSLSNTKITIKSRDLKPRKRLSMRTYLQEVDAHTLVSNTDSCEEKTSIFESII